MIPFPQAHSFGSREYWRDTCLTRACRSRPPISWNRSEARCSSRSSTPVFGGAACRAALAGRCKQTSVRCEFSSSERALPLRGGRAKPHLETVGYSPKRSHRGEYIIPIEASGGNLKGYRGGEHRVRGKNRAVNGTPHRRTMMERTQGQTHRAATIPAAGGNAIELSFCFLRNGSPFR